MQKDNILETKLNDVDLKTKIKGFIEVTKQGHSNKDEVFDYYQTASKKVNEYRMASMELRRVINRWEEEVDDPRGIFKSIVSQYNSKEDAIADQERMRNEMREWMKIADELDAIRSQHKNFNKSVCFSNIRELLKDNPDVKIGQIERDAGIRLGYMSRLEKEDNTAEPSVEFIVTAAKLLNVSVDTLISFDIAGLTPTEKYLVNFVEKLKTDTMADKLNWNVISKNEMDRYETDINGNSLHPLLTMETIYVPSGCDYPEQYDTNMYVSKTFDLETDIYGDCYDLRMKNGSKLYLMNVAKTKKRTSDVQESVIEAVMYVPGGKRQVLATTKDEYPIGELLKNLYKVVKEHMKHPQVNKDAMYAINAFMNDDLSDDPDELPF